MKTYKYNTIDKNNMKIVTRDSTTRGKYSTQINRQVKHKNPQQQNTKYTKIKLLSNKRTIQQ